MLHTWDRNATTRATSSSSFPGTLSSPPTDKDNSSVVLPYAETLYATGSATSAAANPGRYLRSERDPLGGVTTYTVDANGNRTIIRSPRGNDTTQTFDANDNLASKLTPVEAGLPGAPKWLYSYDAFDNPTVTTDPNGAVTVSVYDDVNRLVTMKWTRGPWPTDTSEVPAACRQSTSADAPIPTGRILCTTTRAYDGVDNITATADGNAQTTTSTFDAAHRETKRLVPRDGSTLLRTDTLYFLDGHPTVICTPRQFTEGGSTSCSSSAIYSEHRAYDAAGRLSSSTRYRNEGTPATALVASHVYDADGNEISTTDPNVYTTTRTFDLLDRKTTETAPRDATSGNATLWAYDAVGNVRSVTRPGGVDNGNGADGELVVDGVTASASSDGQAHSSINPFLVPANKNYSKVTVQNAGFISVAPYTAGGGVLELRATGAITVCASCGVTVAGKGPAGGTAGTSATTSGTAGSGNGGGGRGASSAGGGGGGGGGGHAVPGNAGVSVLGSGAAGIPGSSYGRPELTDTASLALLGSGGGGGGGSLTGVGGAGGSGGGFIHLSAASIDIQGSLSAVGTAGVPSAGGAAGAGGAGGGGSGGSVWLSAPTVTLVNSGAIDVAGGAGGASIWGNVGGAGTAGRVRIDADTVNGMGSPPAAWGSYRRRFVGRVSAYRYDADNRQIEQVQGADDPEATRAGLADADGGINIRSRVAFDADGHIVARFEPRAFAASTTPDARYMVRTDFDADGRPVGQWVPRYDDAAASDAGPSATQAADCPAPTATHKPQAVTSQPDFASGVPDYPAGVGACLSRVEYDKAGNAVKTWLPTAGWNTANSTPADANRYVAYGYTDDHLVATVDAPSPKTDGARVIASRLVFDGDGQTVKTTDALSHQQTQAYTSDRLLARSEAQSWRPAGATADLTHVTTYGYDANGNRTTQTDALTQATTWSYWSDDLLKDTTDPGGNKTSYAYDRAGNPTSVTSPSANAHDATNPSGTPTVNTYTADRLLLTATTPVAGDGSSKRQVTYSYDGGGRKTAQQTATLNASGSVTATSGTQRFAYHPDDRLVREIGRDGATITNRYDAAGNRTDVTDSSGSTITATYYLDGLPRSVSDGARPSFYSYDGAGQPTYRADATSTAGNASRYTTSYTSNDAGLPASATSSLTGSGMWTWTWDEAGRPDRETDPNGQTVTSMWNPDDTLARQLLAATTGTLADWTYTYDELFRQKTQGWSGQSAVGGSAVAGTFSYGYDSAGRLTSFNDGTVAKTLTWDRDGNRLSYGAQTFAYNADDSIASTDPDGAGPGAPKNHGYATFEPPWDPWRLCSSEEGWSPWQRTGSFRLSSRSVQSAS